MNNLYPCCEIITSYQLARLFVSNWRSKKASSSLIYRRAPLPAKPAEKGLEGVALQELGRLFQQLLEKQEFKFLLPDEIDISIQEVLERLLEKLEKPLPFEEIFCQTDRKEWISYFLAILEGIKQEKIEFIDNKLLCIC